MKRIRRRAKDDCDVSLLIQMRSMTLGVTAWRHVRFLGLSPSKSGVNLGTANALFIVFNSSMLLTVTRMPVLFSPRSKPLIMSAL